MDELIQKASLETNQNKRSELLQQASAVMLNDYPIISNFILMLQHILSKSCYGYTGENPLIISLLRTFILLIV